MQPAAQPAEVPPLAHPPPRVVVRFTPTAEELSLLLAALYRESPDFKPVCLAERRQRLVRTFLWAAIAALAVLAAPVLLQRWPILMAAWMMTNYWLTAAFAALIPFAYFLWRWAPTRALIDWKADLVAEAEVRRSFWILGRPTELLIEHDGLRIRTAERQLWCAWNNIDQCLITPHGLLVKLGNWEAMLVPRSAFSDPKELGQLVTEIEARQRLHASHVDDLAARILATTDFRCASCSYQLRGIKSARCPECGWRADLQLLHDIEARSRDD
jgi:hypothetical protein